MDESFDQIYREYFEPVYRYALSLTGDRHTAEEISQETFFRAMRSLDSFRGESSVKSWLCAIAKNIWLSDRRRQQLLPLEAAGDPADPHSTPEASVLMRDEGLYVHRLAHGLDEPYREVFLLRTLGQLRFKDIGEVFGKTENWACVIYHRARARIKQQMEGSK